MLLYTLNRAVDISAPANLIEVGESIKMQQAPTDLVSTALDVPVGYPAVRDAVITDDVVVVAFSANVPAASELLAAISSYFLSHGIAPANLNLLIGADASFDRDRFYRALERLQHSSGRGIAPSINEVQILQAPLAEDAYAYLAANSDAEPIYVARSILDADFVLPITSYSSTVDLPSALVGGIAPNFVDQATRLSWHRALIQSEVMLSNTTDAVSELSWLLGMHVIGLVGHDWQTNARAFRIVGQGQVLDNLQSHLDQQVSSANVDLVIVELDIVDTEPCWIRFAGGLIAASQLMAQRGRIIVVADHLPRLTAAFTVLNDTVDMDEQLSKLLKREADLLFEIATIARVLTEHSVFTLELGSKTKKETPWEQLDSIAQCEQMIASSKQAALLHSAGYNAS